jgi:predicted metal-dependent hydrolase
MGTTIVLGGIPIDVVKKDVKHVHLTVHPPVGAVRVTAPLRMKTDTVRVFVIAKLPWIRQQQKKLRAQERETPRDYVARESHYVWGRRYLLKLVEADAPPSVALTPRNLVLSVRPGTPLARRRGLLDEWYRAQLRTAAEPVINKWEQRLGVKVRRLFVQRMKTKWGSCSHAAGSIRLNTELAKKPRECLEYLVVHELVHLIEPTHNQRFLQVLSEAMPQWRHRRELLNRLPVRHEHWIY